MAETAETAAILRMLLKKEGLTVPEDEIEQMSATYERLLANIYKLYFDAVKCESPALIYTAEAL